MSDSNLVGANGAHGFGPVLFRVIGEGKATSPAVSDMAVSGPAVPKVWGSSEEDAPDWLYRYEELGRFIRWTNDQLRLNLGVYFEGVARLDEPVEWYYYQV